MTETISEAYYWIESNYNNLEKCYCELPFSTVQNLPFALYCLAMYVKHKGLK